MPNRHTIIILIAIIAAIPLSSAAYALTPSEILYDPAGNDNGFEFIELIGTEDLSGCSVRDSASTDTLEPLQAGNGSDIILIVESDGAYANLTTGTAIYGAGAAIGNALGNSAESIAISCGGEDILTTSYDITSLPEMPVGASIAWRDGAWVVGAVGGTPGLRDDAPPASPGPEPADDDGIAIIPAGGGSGGGTIPLPSDACNTTLLITVGATEGYPGDTVAFTVVSAEYAAWQAMADGGMVGYGDTRASRTHAITLPHDETEVRLSAESRACGGRQRATRYIAVLTPTKPIGLPPQEPDMPIALNTTVPAQIATARVPSAKAPESAPVAVAQEEPAILTGEAVLDEDRDAVPWIAGFGIVTVLASAGVFLAVHKREREGSGALSDRGGSTHGLSRAARRRDPPTVTRPAPRTRLSGGSQGGPAEDADGCYIDGEEEAKYIRTHTARQGDGNDDRQASAGADEGGVAQGDRDLRDRGPP